MKKKRTYQTVKVQTVRVAELLSLLATGCIVALDETKMKMVVALATIAGEVVKLFQFEHPTETEAFLTIVKELREALGTDNVKVAMEPTGTYGDAMRHQLLGTGRIAAARTESRGDMPGAAGGDAGSPLAGVWTMDGCARTEERAVLAHHLSDPRERSCGARTGEAAAARSIARTTVEGSHGRRGRNEERPST
jgi:hypothetical protein